MQLPMNFKDQKFIQIKTNKKNSYQYLFDIASNQNSILLTKSSFIPNLKYLKSSDLKISSNTSLKNILNSEFDYIYVLDKNFNRFEYGFLKNFKKCIVSLSTNPTIYDYILTYENNEYKLIECENINYNYIIWFLVVYIVYEKNDIL